jgi:hypothetical protein
MPGTTPVLFMIMIGGTSLAPQHSKPIVGSACEYGAMHAYSNQGTDKSDYGPEGRRFLRHYIVQTSAKRSSTKERQYRRCSSWQGWC